MDGIVVAADQTLEWMLPWWLENYRKHNAHPVAFIDLGLSFESKDWCKAHGHWIPLRKALFAEEVPPEIAEDWEETFGKRIWESRDAWFKKPLACLKSPFKRSVWLDVDCEVRAPLAPLFDYADGKAGFAVSKEVNMFFEKWQLYNSGVFAFRQNHPLLHAWAELCLTQTRYFPGDQDILSYLIGKQEIEIEEMPGIYNWSRNQKEVPGIAVLHWHGHHGKAIIRSQLAQRERLLALSANPQESPLHTENRGASQERENR